MDSFFETGDVIDKPSSQKAGKQRQAGENGAQETLGWDLTGSSQGLFSL
jgi:hypothetical protein